MCHLFLRNLFTFAFSHLATKYLSSTQLAVATFWLKGLIDSEWDSFVRVEFNKNWNSCSVWEWHKNWYRENMTDTRSFKHFNT